ncbi:unnamed protein product [Medioppia subpectinata]|uniref:Uncharacterized protein n=1 Tax=Medioppia subpectinata TaxID=1979941 RepID=A0A7R9KF79_9ACAR|nr:unnamed protein product [Medioppia subpectinata]CAG2102224.1 unnamed protein product [Medioppia subpectinata]
MYFQYAETYGPYLNGLLIPSRIGSTPTKGGGNFESNIDVVNVFCVLDVIGMHSLLRTICEHVFSQYLSPFPPKHSLQTNWSSLASSDVKDTTITTMGRSLIQKRINERNMRLMNAIKAELVDHVLSAGSTCGDHWIHTKSNSLVLVFHNDIEFSAFFYKLLSESCLQRNSFIGFGIN